MTTTNQAALVRALETIMAASPVSMEDLIERQLIKLLHEPQVKLALEKLAMKDNTTIEEAARAYLKKIALIADDTTKSSSKIKKLVATIKKPEA